MIRFLLSTTLLLFSVCLSKAAVIYVDASATGSNNGSNWNNAFTDLQDALVSSLSGDEIWVAAGTYRPVLIGQEVSFEIPSGVGLYGGFAGTETNRGQRNWYKNPTILSGEVGFIATTVDNAHAVVRIENATEEVIMDGFTIKDSYRDQSSSTAYAALVISDSFSRIGHCVFTNNRGVDASAVLITGNSDVLIHNSLFHNNLAISGGTITQEAGTGSYDLDIIHCTLTRNDHQNPSEEVVLQDLHWELKNSVLWFNDNITEQISTALNLNSALSNSVIQGLSFAPAQVVSSDPAFSNITSNDFRPSLGTSVEELGSIAASFATRDLAGNPRTVGANPDAGCYEYKGQRIIYVDPISTVANPDGNSWATAYPGLVDALPDAVSGDDLWVANGTQYITQEGEREKYLLVSGQIDIYGGFQGNETDFEERDWRTLLSVISGNGGNNQGTDDNSYKIFYIAPGSECSIDGLTIQSGVADGEEDFFQRGAGVHVGPDALCFIRNATLQFLTAQQGGAAIEAEGVAVVENCRFNDFNDPSLAQHLINASNNLIVRGCLFNENQFSGSAIAFSGDVFRMNGCTFYDNLTDAPFFDIGNPSADALVRNSVFSLSLFGSSAEMVSATAPIEFTHCILDGYELTESQTGEKVYFEEPYFLGPSEDDFRLCWASIGYSNGDASGFDWTEDLNGNNRLASGGIDFGAIENNSPRPVLRVDPTATDNENGLSWEDAFTTLEDALSAATCGTEIWIAEGVYTPHPSNRIFVFNVPGNVSLYGGFGGFEFDRDERDWNLYSSIISGEIGNTNTVEDNSYRLISATGAGTVVMDGLFMRDSYSVSGDPVASALTAGSNTRLRLNNLRFINNSANSGCAMRNTSQDIIVSNSLFAGNHTESGNTVTQNQDASITFLNCTFSENTHVEIFAGEIGGDVSSTATVLNCIIYGNDNNVPLNNDYDVRNSIITGGYEDGINVIDADPLFVNPASLNFRLTVASPAVDSGDDALALGSFDIAGNPRIQGAAVDMGCFEFEDFCPGDLNGDLVVNTGDLTILLSAYGCTSNCTYDLTGDTLVNTADLQVLLTNFGIVCGDLN